MLEPANCPHDHLYFGSGAFYIFCRDCLQSWVARDEADGDLAYDQGNRTNCGDDRVRCTSRCEIVIGGCTGHHRPG